METESEQIKKKIEEADMILVGIGEEFTGEGTEKKDVCKACRNLWELLKEKNYFIVSLCDGLPFDRDGWKEEKIVYPLMEMEREGESERWEQYLSWFQGTLNRKVLLLELGVGFRYPDLIRFPFEKAAYYNQKSEFIRVSQRFFQMPELLGGKGNSVKKNPVELLKMM